MWTAREHLEDTEGHDRQQRADEWLDVAHQRQQRRLRGHPARDGRAAGERGEPEQERGQRVAWPGEHDQDRRARERIDDEVAVALQRVGSNRAWPGTARRVGTAGRSAVLGGGAVTLTGRH